MQLLKKMFRDVRKNKLQFLTIFLMAVLGVLTFSGLDSVLQGLVQSMDSYYEQVNMANAWFYVREIEEDIVENIQGNENIQNVQSRLIWTYMYDNKQLELIVSATNEISKPYLISGDEYDENTDKKRLWLDQSFASENNYAIGDYIKINNSDVEIAGLILSAEKIYAPPIGDAITDFSIYGYAYMTSETFKSILGYYMPNQLIVTVDQIEEIKSTAAEIEDYLKDSCLTSILYSDQSSINHINERVRQLTQFAYIFPALFFLLALLTMVTTMRRLIANQRVQIGTLMSLGYSNFKIRVHYMGYGLWIGLLGGIIGVVIGHYVIPPSLIESCRHLAIVPYWTSPITMGSVLSVLLMVICCVMAVIVSCGKQLKAMPAFVLRGNIQKTGKHLVLERVPKFWDVLSLKAKSTFRNISRNNIRSIMGIIGVLGSLVLLITGLGMKNSLDYTVSYTYSSFYTYNTKIDLYDPAVTANTLGISDEVQYLQEQGVEIKSNSNQKYTALLSIIGNGNFVWIRESDGRQTNISDTNGIIISEKFAETLNVSEGDEISWRLVGGEWKSIKIGRIIIHSLPRSMLVSEESWKYSGQDFVGNVILTETKTDDLNLDKNLIKKVQSIDKQEESMQAVCDSTASIIYLLIFVAILLATVVLSGLGLLNFTEMSREYATLKVIGLYPSEIRNLAFTENLILSLIGWIIGLPIAKWFVDVYMKLLSNDTIVCIPKVKTITYVAASAMVLLCSIGINLLLSIKVNKIDMVSALKSME